MTKFVIFHKVVNLTVTYTNKTRISLLITLVTLKEAYGTEMIQEDKNIDFNLWCTEKSGNQPTFKHWHIVIKIILLYLAMMKPIRDGEFDDFKSSLSAIMPLFIFFANDSTHFSRWGTIHLHDMLNLGQNSPSIYDQFIS